jgi:hypothetical protein
LFNKLLELAAPVAKGKRGRPKGTKTAAKVAAVVPPAKKGKPGITPEGRAAISVALKRRWAEKKKQSAK